MRSNSFHPFVLKRKINPSKIKVASESDHIILSCRQKQLENKKSDFDVETEGV